VVGSALALGLRYTGTSNARARARHTLLTLLVQVGPTRVFCMFGLACAYACLCACYVVLRFARIYFIFFVAEFFLFHVIVSVAIFHVFVVVVYCYG
jgi:hypothetical protein